MPWGTVVVRRNGLVAITGNCPTHVELADEFRDCIEAPDDLITVRSFNTVAKLISQFDMGRTVSGNSNQPIPAHDYSSPRHTHAINFSLIWNWFVHKISH